MECLAVVRYFTCFWLATHHKLSGQFPFIACFLNCWEPSKTKRQNEILPRVKILLLICPQHDSKIITIIREVFLSITHYQLIADYSSQTERNSDRKGQ